ncbi:MAG: HAD-IA family hydrolase [Thermoplasmata archaeon]|nr:HAD-IA family hydrolase [Thermoplasmata archaeon]
MTNFEGKELQENRYKAVFFDAGGTLIYAPLEQTFVDVCAKHGVDLDIERVCEAYKVFVREDTSFFKKNRDLASQDPVKFWNQCNKQMLEYLGVEGDTESIARRITNVFPTSATIQWRSYSDVSQSLAELKGMGLVLGVISNFDPFLKDILARLDLAQHFNLIITSSEVGILKPDPGIFRLALGRVGLNAEDSIYVGDAYYPDIVGATSAGLTPVLIDRDHNSGEVDCMKIFGLDELVSVLSSNRQRDSH